MASTNSKNSRMRYGGYNNNRIYQSALRCRKSARGTNKFFKGYFGFIGLLIMLVFGLLSDGINKMKTFEQELKNDEELIEKEMERQASMEEAKQRRARKSAAEKEQKLFERWRNNQTKYIFGVETTITLENYKAMTTKQRNEWDKKDNELSDFYKTFIVVRE